MAVCATRRCGSHLAALPMDASALTSCCHRTEKNHPKKTWKQLMGKVEQRQQMLDLD